MRFDEQMNRLRSVDGLRDARIRGKQCLLHRDHRWTLVILHWAQQAEMAPAPWNLVLLDRHHDAFDPECKHRLDRVLKEGLKVDELFDICSGEGSESLSTQDNDWICAGMRLGLIGDAVVFGAKHKGSGAADRIVDVLGHEHSIRLLPRLKSALAYQGSLGDTRTRNERVWNTLGWQQHPDGRHWFCETDTRFLFDIDLDYFAFECEDYCIPWPCAVFEDEFLTPSSHFTTEGRSARDFFLGLLDRAAMLTVATEPRFCGDGDTEGRNVRTLLRRMNHYAFEGQIQFDDPRLGAASHDWAELLEGFDALDEGSKRRFAGEIERRMTPNN